MTTTTRTTPQDAVERDGTISVDDASSSGGPASVLRRLARADDGAATAEYAIVIMAPWTSKWRTSETVAEGTV